MVARAVQHTGAEDHEGARGLLLVRDDADRVDLASILRARAVEVREASCEEEALRLLRSDAFDSMFVEEELSSRSGIEFLADARRIWPRIARVLIASSSQSEVALEAINRAGVCYYLGHPWGHRDIDEMLSVAVPGSAARPAQEPDVVRPSAPCFAGIIGESRSMRELLDVVRRIANTESTVLITGETGSGKELVGRAIHQASPRRDAVFAAVNSAAFPETLLESELFGHRRGSFTGATAHGKGLFAHADGGTVFLDEVAEMPLSMQAKLLRFLQTGEIRPVGSETSSNVDVRLVAATNKSLEEQVSLGNFREDLYYRLAVIPIEVPPLRERIDDIPLLVRHFLLQIAGRDGRKSWQIDSTAVDELMRHDWPGNVRELENAIERTVALCTGDRITTADIATLRRPRPALKPSSDRIESLPVLERRHIIETLDRVGWNRKRAAEILEISTTTLWRRLKEFGIDSSTHGPAGVIG